MTAQFLSSVAILVIALHALHGVTAFNVASNSRSANTNLDAVSRREALVASASSAAILAGVPMEALADLDVKPPQDAPPASEPDYKTAAKFYFNGVFRDKKHPEGYRIVAGALNKNGSVTLQDKPGGKVFDIPMKAKTDEKTGKITVDMNLSSYRPEFGSSIVATVTKDGCLKFPDGNQWIKDKGVAGLYIDGFAPYPKYRRVVIPSKGRKVDVTMISGKQVFDVFGVDLKEGKIQVDFPGKQCLGKFNRKKGSITWLDGNVWTKV